MALQSLRGAIADLDADDPGNWGVGFPAAQNNDTTTELTLATRFTVGAPAPATGVEILVPTTLPTGPSPAFVSIWDVLDEINPLATGEFEWADMLGLEGTWQTVDLDAPLELDDSSTYKAACQHFERWSGTAGYGFPLSYGLITADAANGWIRVGYGYPNIQQGAGYSFGISPVIDVGSSAPLGTVTEAGTVHALGRVKRRALGAVTEVGTAQALGGAAPAVIPGTLSVRESGAGLEVRSAWSGLTVREG